MFFRVASDSDAEIVLVLGTDALNELACISIASRCRCEALFAHSAVSSECNDVVDAKEFEIVKSAFDLLLSVASADKVWNDFNVIFRHDGSAYGRFIYAVSHKSPCETSVWLLCIFVFISVACDIDVLRTEFHEWSNALDEFLLGNASERWYNLQRRECLRAVC